MTRRRMAVAPGAGARWRNRVPVRARVAACLGVVLAGAASATPDEEAFLQVWARHVHASSNHEAVIQVCRETLQRRGSDDLPVLGPYQPVIRTVEAWRLLQLGRDADAVRVFKTVIGAPPSTDPRARAADTLARRWLTRFDREAVVAALRAYHRGQVAFPADLSVFESWPRETQPPLRDRFNTPWVYRLSGFRKLTGTTGQRYVLHSRAIGGETSSLEAARRLVQPADPVVFVRKNSGTPALVEFRFGSAAPQTAVIQENGIFKGIRFVALDSLGRFALLTDEDFWFLAVPAGARP